MQNVGASERKICHKWQPSDMFQKFLNSYFGRGRVEKCWAMFDAYINNYETIHGIPMSFATVTALLHVQQHNRTFLTIFFHLQRIVECNTNKCVLLSLFMRDLSNNIIG